MPPLETSPTSARYWRSLEELSARPELRELVAREYPGQTWESLPPATRRQFLKVMGASLALAGLAGCRWPKENIVPFARPVGYTPGRTLQYATAMEIGGFGTGLLATSYDGRPIKIEGNPNHPASLGASDSFAQASVLELYDPARSQVPTRREGGQRLASTWEEFARFGGPHFASLAAGGGAGLRVLSEASSSPSLAAMRERLLARFPRARWVEYEAVSRDHERAGAALAFGRPLRGRLALDAAKAIVCLDADPLLTHPAAVRHARDFAAGRRAEQGWMNRLYAFEGAFSLTGTLADHRVALRTDRIPLVAAHLAAELFLEQGLPLPADAPALRASLEAFRSLPEKPTAVTTAARDLLSHRGESLVLAGPRQPAEVHALTHWINAALGNIGRTVRFTEEIDPDRPSHRDAIVALTEEMRSGSVETLVILGGNPVFDAPADLDFGAALAKVATTVHLSLFDDETSRACAWHLPRAHYLESWGDVRSIDGTWSVVQPLIAPLYGGKSPIELLSVILDELPESGHEIVRRTLLASYSGLDFEAFWRAALHDGVVPGSVFPEVMPAPVPAGITINPPAAQGLEIVFLQDAKVYDGRFANNAWLQELPDPLTKITWDNAALLSPATAAELGVKADDVVIVRLRGREIELPVYVMPGQANGSLAVCLGYGRTAAGKVGNHVGADACRLRTSEAMEIDHGTGIQKTGRRHTLACTQNHHAIDMVGLRAMQKRIGELVREGDLETFRRHPEFAREEVHHPPSEQLFEKHPYDEGYQWGMAIDLNSCTGCGACVVACTAENNVPIVGRDQVIRGREMHWIRIDRYFTGDMDAPHVVHQPVACVHCENAPCEQVCPVAATTHSNEGLNQMVYNRCIGTRYCSNNCPYKVRRFNWFNNHRDLSRVEMMVYNPEVSLRSRGVMEKCTYCVQRIERAKITSKNEGRTIHDGEVTPACAQACPAQAIVFGDLRDPESRVRKLQENPRSYGMLAEINTRPRTLYLAKLRNQADGMASEPAAEGGEHHG